MIKKTINITISVCILVADLQKIDFN